MRILSYSIAVSFILSYLAKVFIDAFLLSPVYLIGQWVRLEYTQNPGIAFGVLLPSVLQPFLIIAAIAVLLWVAMHSQHTRISAVGFGLVLGGALGNIVDRSFDGLVTDFIRIGWFPIFNVADACISIGVICLLGESLWTRFRKTPAPAPLA